MTGKNAGDALLRIGKFTRAEANFRSRLAIDGNDVAALLGLSATLRRKGKQADARELLVRATHLRPLELPSRMSATGPIILRPRCIDAANYCVVKQPGGGFRRKYKGGHFALRDLLPNHSGNLVTANLVGGAPGPLYAAPTADLFINTVACADRSRASLNAMSRFLEDRPGLPVINRPEAVALTTRDGNFERLADVEGARFPLTLRLVIDAPEPVLFGRIAKAGFSLPLIIRATGRQTGRELHFCTTRTQVAEALREFALSGEAYVIAYIDSRGAKPFFQKARAFFINGAIYPVAWLTSDNWQIHSGDRYRIMTKDLRYQAEERHYLKDPEAACGSKAWRALHEVNSRLGLDFAGIDFSVCPDGDLLIFEANAAMRHNFDHVPAFGYTKPYLERISRAFADMVDQRLNDRALNPVLLAATI